MMMITQQIPTHHILTRWEYVKVKTITYISGNIVQAKNMILNFWK